MKEQVGLCAEYACIAKYSIHFTFIMLHRYPAKLFEVSIIFKRFCVHFGSKINDSVARVCINQQTPIDAIMWKIIDLFYLGVTTTEHIAPYSKYVEVAPLVVFIMSGTQMLNC